MRLSFKKETVYRFGKNVRNNFNATMPTVAAANNPLMLMTGADATGVGARSENKNVTGTVPTADPGGRM